MKYFLSLSLGLFTYLAAAQYGPISLYKLNTVGYANGSEIHYISLTEGYPFDDFKNNPILEKKYLGEVAVVNENYHVLSQKARNTFLNRINLNPTDSVYIYQVALDSVFKFALAQLPLVAFMNIYGEQDPVLESDYIIALELRASTVKKLDQSFLHYNNFVFIGAKNPFSTGYLRPITWQPLASQLFPETPIKSDRNWFTNANNFQWYNYQQEGYQYYLKVFLEDATTLGNQLLVKKENSATFLINRVFARSEGTYLQPIRTTLSARVNPNLGQYTGRLFKNLPPVVFGFASYSFGCQRLHFIAQEQPRAWIKCDNRH